MTRPCSGHYDVKRDTRELERERAAPDESQAVEQKRISWLEQELDNIGKAIREVREYIERAREWGAGVGTDASAAGERES